MWQLLELALTIFFITALSKEFMAKPMHPLDIMNVMGNAAHKKAQPPMDDDSADAAAPSPATQGAPKSKQQKVAIAAKMAKKGPKQPPVIK